MELGNPSHDSFIIKIGKPKFIYKLCLHSRKYHTFVANVHTTILDTLKVRLYKADRLTHLTYMCTLN